MSVEARLRAMTALLYDARTPARIRAELQFEVSILRSRMANCDALDALIGASVGDDECEEG